MNGFPCNFCDNSSRDSFFSDSDTHLSRLEEALLAEPIQHQRPAMPCGFGKDTFDSPKNASNFLLFYLRREKTLKPNLHASGRHPDMN